MPIEYNMIYPKTKKKKKQIVEKLKRILHCCAINNVTYRRTNWRLYIDACDVYPDT